MEQYSSEEVNTRLAGQDGLLLMWNPKVHYRVHKSSPSVTIMCHMNPGDSFVLNIFMAHFDIIFPSTRRPFKRTFPSIFQLKFCINFFSRMCVLYRIFHTQFDHDGV
jgi:hypothetical protein